MHYIAFRLKLSGNCSKKLPCGHVVKIAHMPGTVDFSGEDELSALLLAMVIHHCIGYSLEDQRAGLTSHFHAPHTTDDDLDSYGDPSDADAMIVLHEQGLIEISQQDGPRILAKVTPEGRALLARLSLEQQRKAGARWQYRPAS